jgi:hypothetical protein
MMMAKNCNSYSANNPEKTSSVGSSKFYILLLLASLLITTEGLGQLILDATQRKMRTTQKRIASPAARTQAINPMKLPFWDDFSFTPVDDPDDTTSNTPLDSIWVNSQSVWINQGIGVNAPSINVATFDGLNEDGLPYSADILANGYRDSLVSHRIDLSETAVAVAERNTVYLSFAYQWQGNGEPPDQNDFLQLEMRDSDSTWAIVMTIVPKTTLSRTEFYDTIIQIPNTGDRFFFHKNFQFRFQNFGRKSGPFDTWNIDYIYLNKNRTLSSLSFPDRSIASQPTQLFGRYTAVPLEHFRKHSAFDSVEFDVKNLKKAVVEIAIGYEAYMTFRNYDEGIATKHTIPFSSGGVGPNGGLMDPSERARVRMENIPDTSNPQQFSPTADSMDIDLQVKVISGDNLDSSRPGFLPVDFRINDTLTTTYRLKDYYAYDDGTAEFSARLNTTTDKLAYAFDMLTDDVDTLVGFDIYFPDFGLTSNPLVNFTVYEDVNGLPGDPLYTLSSYTLKVQNAVNKFQRINILETVRVQNRFYIGYTSPSVRIGLDYNNNTADHIFVNVGGGWYQNTDVNGSLMIRPLFGKGVDSPVGIPEEVVTIQAYPNPNNGEFFIDRKTELVQIINLAGQSIPFTVQEYSNEQQKVNLQQTAPGLYILKVRKRNSVIAHKIVVR